MPRSNRWLSHFALLAVLALLVGLLPVSQAEARRRTQAQPIDDLLADFAQGDLQRTALAPIGAAEKPDEGGVQLAPIAYIQEWNRSSFSLKECVTSHSTASLNGSVYILGGLVPLSTDCRGLTATTDHVWRGVVNPQGLLADDWTAQPALPMPAGAPEGNGNIPCTQTSAPKGGRSAMATASFSTGAGGFIYAIGGALDSQNGDQVLPSSFVSIATVGANGDITGWQAGPCLPLRLQNASATTIAINGETFIYVVGGLFRQKTVLGFTTRGLRTTYFARLDSGTGEIKKVSDGSPGWDVNVEDLPIPEAEAGNGDAGLWNAALLPYVDRTGAQPRAALYIGGGEKVVGSATFNERVFRGLIDASTKRVTWKNGFTAALSSPRTSLSAIEYNGTLMYIGGRTGSSDASFLNEVLSNQVDDQLNLPTGSAANFYQSSQTFDRPRYNHTSVVVSTATDAFVYVLGGQGRATDGEDTATNSFFIGRIGTSATVNGYARSGWFIGTPRRLVIDNAKVLAVTWTADIKRENGAMDVQIEYRTTGSPALNEDAWSAWTAVSDPDAPPGTSTINGINSIEFPQGVSALYFQYRARFTTYTPATGGTWKTPALLDVNIEIEVPGYPNLQVPSAQSILVGGLLRGIQADIANRNPLPANEPLQAVSDGRPGTFFVSVFVFKPSETPTPPTLGQLSQAYAEIDKEAFPFRTAPYEFQLSVRNWCSTEAGNCDTPYDITRNFTEIGDYTVYVLVDNVADATGQPYGNVEEADVAATLGETDNLYELKVSVTTACPPEGCGLPPDGGGGGTATPTIFLPIIGKA